MLKRLLLASLVSLPALCVSAQAVEALHISGIDIDRNDSTLSVAMTVHPSQYSLRLNSQMEITPCVVSSDSTRFQALPTILVTGRNAYYYALRNGMAEEGTLLRASKDADSRYSVTLPYESWMAESSLVFRAQDISCCGEPPKEPEFIPVADMDFLPPVFVPDFEIVPVHSTGVKTRTLDGRAYVNFPVNRTEIYPEYMNNPVELRKIIDTIDKVRHDKDASVDTILLTGYASPEGPYSNNVRLAKGRTEAVKSYVMKQYDFPADVYFTSSVPEDWGGLREYVAASILPDRQGIIDFIDDTTIPIERKNDLLRQRFPAAYPGLLKNVYPSLRHTDYYIHYVVRHYTTLEEIREVYETNPGNLDLGEFYTLAESYGRGSKKYAEVLETAVRLNPTLPVANLNAATAMMERGDYDRASDYLKRAGDTAEAEYSRGALAALLEDNEAAARYFEKAAGLGSKKASEALAQLRAMQNQKAGKVTFRQ